MDHCHDGLVGPKVPPGKKQMAGYIVHWTNDRIHIHNAEAILLNALPYYSEPVFMRLLDVIPTPLPEVFSFLHNSKTTVQNPNRQLIVRALSSDSSLFLLVQSHVVDVIKQGRDYNALLAFWSATSIWSMSVMKDAGKNAEDIIAGFITSVSELLPVKKNADAQIAAYMVMAVLANQFDLDSDVTTNAVVTIASSWSKASMKSGFACITQLVKGNGDYAPLTKQVWTVLEKVKGADQLISELSESYSIGGFIAVWAVSLLKFAPEKVATIASVLRKSPKLTEAQLFAISKAVCGVAKAVPAGHSDDVVALIELILSDSGNTSAFTRALKSEKLTYPALELLLQSTIKRQEDASTTSQPEDDDDEEALAEVLPEATEPAVELKQSSRPSFLLSDANEEFDKIVAVYTVASVKRSAVSQLPKKLKISEDALPSFLARTWTGPYAQLTQVAALRDFITIVDKSKQTDFQAFVPLLLAGLSSPAERVRRMAGAAIVALRAKYPLKKPTVLGLDTIYGPGPLSANVKWLSVKDLTQLLDKVVIPALDESYLNAANVSQYLLRAIAEVGSKSFASTVSAFLMSHALSVDIPRIKASLLAIVAKLDRVDHKALEPLFASWIGERESWVKRCTADKFDFATLEAAVVTSVRDKANVWFLEKCIKSVHADLAELAGRQVVKLWPSLGETTQLELFRVLLDVAVDDSYVFDAQDTLAEIEIAGPLLLAALEDSKLQTERSSDVAKRRRRSSNTAKRQLQGELMSVAERHLRKVTLVFELIDSNKPKASVKLLESLFSLLDEILSLGTDSNIPVFYTQQLLANCMISVVEQLKNGEDRVGKLNSNNMRVNSIVQTIRSSSSPQVQNRFLLLVSSLASLEPELVLHSVMPIFTFMGANTLRQDDEYSAHVIEETISKVIPQMLKQEESAVDADIDVVLKSFVVAFDHIPRHRRVMLFSALVRAIGPQLSLHKLLALLAQKYSDARGKRKNVDVRQLALFGESFLASFTVLDQVKAIEKYVTIVDGVSVAEEDEAANGAGQNLFMSASGAPRTADERVALKANMLDYLAQLIGDEEAVSGSQLLRVRMTALSREARESTTKQEEYEAVLAVCSSTLERLLAARKDTTASRVVLDSAFGLIGQCLNILAVGDFVRVTRTILGSAVDVDIKAKALKLVQAKFETELSTDTDASTAAFEAVDVFMEHLKAVSAHNTADSIEISALMLDDLDVLLSKFGANAQQDALLKVLDVVVGPAGLQSESAEVMVPAAACTNSLCTILGARMIGHFGRIVPVCFKRVEESLKTSGEESDTIQLSVFALLAGLVKRIPAFMTSSLKKTFELVFLSGVSTEFRGNLLSTCIEVMEPRDVLLAFISAWKFAFDTSFESVSLFLENLDLAVESSQKKVVSSQGAPLVGFLLDAFASVASNSKYDTNTVNRITNLINSTAVKIVMKLNDKTFRPLFIRMVRWAVDIDGSSYSPKAVARLAVFFKFVVKLLQSLKSIITDYYGYLLDSVCDILALYASGEFGSLGDHASLRRSILNSLNVSFQNDNSEFWQSQARFDKISEALLSQIPTVGKDVGMLLVKTIVSLAEVSSSQEYHKSINDGLMQYMQSDSTSNEKTWAVRTLHGLYSNLGEEWVSMLPQLVPLIAELLEDDDEAVELLVRRKLVPVVEDVLGESLDRYLS